MDKDYDGVLEGYYKIKFEPNVNNMIWSVTTENKLAVIPFNKFKSVFTSDIRKIEVEMIIINSEITSPEDFKKLYENNFAIENVIDNKIEI